MYACMYVCVYVVCVCVHIWILVSFIMVVVVGTWVNRDAPVGARELPSRCPFGLRAHGVNLNLSEFRRRVSWF